MRELHYSLDPCNGSSLTPDADIFVSNLDVAEIVMLSLCAFCTVICVAIYIEAFIHLQRRSDEQKDMEKHHPYFLLALYPVVGVSSLVSACVPRSSMVGDLAASIYLSICIWFFLSYIISHFGGRRKMLEILDGQNINYRAPPLTCCCPCLPQPPVSRKRIRRLIFFVGQVIIVRPLLLYITSVIFVNHMFQHPETAHGPKVLSTTLNTLNVVSTLLAVWGLNVCYRLSKDALVQYHIGPKFVSVQLVLMCLNLQSSIFGILVTTGGIKCLPGRMSPKVHADFINHLMLMAEMFLISILARHFYRKNHPGTFKTYENNENGSEMKNNEKSINKGEDNEGYSHTPADV